MTFHHYDGSTGNPLPAAAQNSAFAYFPGGARMSSLRRDPSDITLDAFIAFMADRPRLAEYVVETLITKLDARDGDPDLEDGADAEPCNEDGGDINDEPQDDNELDDDFSDREHSLGSLDRCLDQRGWSHGLNSDLEEDGRRRPRTRSRRRLPCGTVVEIRPSALSTSGGRHA